MGIFSHFRKKEREPSAVEDTLSSIAGATSAHEHAVIGDTIDPLADPSTIQRDLARATVMKIDAIESEMTLEFVNTTPLGRSGNTLTPVVAEHAATYGTAHASEPSQAGPKAAIDQRGESTPPTPGAPASSAPTAGSVDPVTEWPDAPALEEAAILFASNQVAVAQQILQNAIQSDTLGPATQRAWSMLFDLHQLTGQREQFDALSLAYAGKFETSPPSWRDAAMPTPANSKPATTPSVVFSGVLDAQSAKQLARTQKLAEHHSALRLEFSRISSVDPIGCGLLLRVLKKLQKSGLELILVGAPDLASKIRAILMVGRRDETEAPWLLLLEILQLLNRQQEFEDVSIDYCITFEVSPPAFMAPKTKISTAHEGSPAESSTEVFFLLPRVIEGDIQHLVATIANHLGQHPLAMLDCQQLVRIDFSAAGELLNSLKPQSGQPIELHNLNYLVTTLLQTLGLPPGVRIMPRKS